MMIRPIASGLHQNSTTFKLLVFHTVLLWLVTSWSSDSWFVLIPDWFWSFVLLSVRFHQSPFRALLMLLILSYMLQNSSIVVQNTPHTQEQSTVSSPTYLSPFLALWFILALDLHPKARKCPKALLSDFLVLSGRFNDNCYKCHWSAGTSEHLLCCSYLLSAK